MKKSLFCLLGIILLMGGVISGWASGRGVKQNKSFVSGNIPAQYGEVIGITSDRNQYSSRTRFFLRDKEGTIREVWIEHPDQQPTLAGEYTRK